MRVVGAPPDDVVAPLYATRSIRFASRIVVMHCPIDLVVPITCDQSSRRVEIFWLGSWGQSWRSSGSGVAEVAECLQPGSARYTSYMHTDYVFVWCGVVLAPRFTR